MIFNLQALPSNLCSPLRVILLDPWKFDKLSLLSSILRISAIMYIYLIDAYSNSNSACQASQFE